MDAESPPYLRQNRDGTRPSKTPVRASAAAIAEDYPEPTRIPTSAIRKMFSTGGRCLRNSPEQIPPASLTTRGHTAAPT